MTITRFVRCDGSPFWRRVFRETECTGRLGAVITRTKVEGKRTPYLTPEEEDRIRQLIAAHGADADVETDGEDEIEVVMEEEEGERGREEEDGAAAVNMEGVAPRDKSSDRTEAQDGESHRPVKKPRWTKKGKK